MSKFSLKDLFGVNAGEIIKEIGSIIDDSTFSKEERAEKVLEYLKLETDALKVHQEDRASARAMQIAALQQSDKFSKRFAYFLAGFILVSAVGAGAALMFLDIPENNQRLVEMFFDIFLFSGAIVIIQFFFGSSSGSAAKQDMIKEVLAGNATVNVNAIDPETGEVLSKKELRRARREARKNKK